MRFISISNLIGFSAISFASFTFAMNAGDHVLTQENNGAIDPIAYWTPERMKEAKPMPLPKADPKRIKELKESDLPQGEPTSSEGAPPTDKINEQTLFNVEQTSIKPQESFDRGTFNQHFSSSRLVPMTADLAYPYRAVGKLFFTIPGRGDFVCSASAIRHRVVLTAGHCVHKGSGGTAGFYANFLFVPAFRNGTAPLLSWNWAYAAVTGTWASGGGGVPNAADYAMLEMGDKVVNDVVRRLYNYTGYLGYQTLSLIPNHSHILGYPCNLDSCLRMHQVTAQSARQVAPNNVEYGSDMRGGSSGGPFVQNFGEFSTGQTGGLNAGLNRVIGVVSYGYDSTDPKAQGASIPDSRFTNLLSLVCNHRVGNCTV